MLRDTNTGQELAWLVVSLLFFAQTSPASANIPSPWKQELAQLKKLSVSSPDEESASKPEWLRIAEERQKTVGTGGA
jgi:hypothetical protein